MYQAVQDFVGQTASGLQEWWENIETKTTVNMPGYHRFTRSWTHKTTRRRYKFEKVRTPSGSTTTLTETYRDEDKVVTLKVDSTSNRVDYKIVHPNRERHAQMARSQITVFLLPIAKGIASSHIHPLFREMGRPSNECKVLIGSKLLLVRKRLPKHCPLKVDDMLLCAYFDENNATLLTEKAIILQASGGGRGGGGGGRGGWQRLEIEDVDVARNVDSWSIFGSSSTLILTTTVVAGAEDGFSHGTIRSKAPMISACSTPPPPPHSAGREKHSGDLRRNADTAVEEEEEEEEEKKKITKTSKPPSFAPSEQKSSIASSSFVSEISVSGMPVGAAEYIARALNRQKRRLSGRRVLAIQLESQNFQPNKCHTERPILSVLVTKQLSKTVPKENANYGFDGRTLWVDKGCRAVFMVEISNEDDRGAAGGPGAANSRRNGSTTDSKRKEDDVPPVFAHFLHSKIFDVSVIREIFHLLHGEDAKSAGMPAIEPGAAAAAVGGGGRDDNALVVADQGASGALTLESECIPLHLRGILRSQMRNRYL